MKVGGLGLGLGLGQYEGRRSPSVFITLTFETVSQGNQGRLMILF